MLSRIIFGVETFTPYKQYTGMYGGRKIPCISISRHAISISKKCISISDYIRSPRRHVHGAVLVQIWTLARSLSSEAIFIVDTPTESFWVTVMNHNIDMSMSSLKQILKKENLKRRPVVSDALLRQTLAAIRVRTLT